MPRLSALTALLFLLGLPLSAQPGSGGRIPVIDMHLHAGSIRSPAHFDSVASALRAQGVVLAALSVHDPAAVRWHDPDPDMFWIGPAFPCYEGRFAEGDPCFEDTHGWPDLGWLRSQYEEGRVRLMGELYYVYHGIPPTDERLEPYWALAEELDIPVGVHTGRRARDDLPEGCCPMYDDDYGDPSLLAPVLQRHPELRVWLMHAPGAAEWVDETIALMQTYPNVFAEMSVVNSIAPAPAHAGALKELVEAGLSDRIMFGSDNQPHRPILERIDAIPFLTDAQKRGIYCQNAARFLKLGPERCRL